MDELSKAPTTEQKWGLWDRTTSTWIGKEGSGGPNLYTDETIARTAATILGEMFKQRGRFRALIIIPGSFRFIGKEQSILSCREVLEKYREKL